MSTRATIILTDSDGNRKQFYHHTDGYPEYMGETLKNFLWVSNVCSRNEETEDGLKNMFLELLEKEGCFEPEELGSCHSDIEYMWFVNLNKRGEDDIISYTEFYYSSDKAEQIKDQLTCENGAFIYYGL